MTETQASGSDPEYGTDFTEDITPQEGRDRLIAGLLMALTTTTDFRERQAIADQVKALNGGEYPTAHQQAILITMHHEQEHHDSGPDTAD